VSRGALAASIGLLLVAACRDTPGNVWPVSPVTSAPATSGTPGGSIPDAGDAPEGGSPDASTDAGATETAVTTAGNALAGICIRRERDLPIDEAGGLAPKPLPRGLYWIQIDDGPRMEVRPDTGTRLPPVDTTRPHRVSLFRKDRRVASSPIRFDRSDVCLGLSNYSGSVSVYGWDAKRCGCANDAP